MMNELKPIGTVGGHTVYVQDNEAGGQTYRVDDIGGGRACYDTCIDDPAIIEFCQLHAGLKQADETTEYWKRRAHLAERVIKGYQDGTMHNKHVMFALWKEFTKEGKQYPPPPRVKQKANDVLTPILKEYIDSNWVLTPHGAWQHARKGNAGHYSYSTITNLFRHLIREEVNAGRAVRNGDARTEYRRVAAEVTL